jgi:hypothetical protein
VVHSKHFYCQRCFLNTFNYSLAASPNGWTDSDAALAWIRDVFDPETQPAVPGDKRLLIMDGHRSHCSLEFLLYAERKGITVLLLPPHTTHRLQPLDVGIFGPLSKAWSRIVREWQDRGQLVDKTSFLSMYNEARHEAFTSETINGAFVKCGIFPYDPSVITEEDIAPAEITTCQSSQPLPAYLPSFLEVVQEPSSPPFLNAISGSTSPIIDSGIDLSHPSPASTPPPISWRAPLAAVHKNAEQVIQLDKPEEPKEYATKQELHGTINTLFRQLDRANEELLANFARMTLADKENERIRQKLYGNKKRKAGYTHLKTGARIMTAPEQLEALCKEDRRKALDKAFKELKPILKVRQKMLDKVEAEWEAEREAAEMAKVKAAEIEAKVAENEMDKTQRVKERAEKWMNAAEERREKATTPSQKRKADESYKKWKHQYNVANSALIPLTETYSRAVQAHERILAERQARLDEILAAEARYEAALEQEAREKEIEDQQREQANERRGNLPRKAKNSLAVWKKRFEEEEIEKPLTKFDQDSIKLGPQAVRMPEGSFLQEQAGPATPGIESVTPGDNPVIVNDDNIDPALFGL